MANETNGIIEQYAAHLEAKAARVVLRLTVLFGLGGAVLGGFPLFYKSHADLGEHWSITLEVREQHRLITQGVYRRIRHPMYSALVLYSLGHALVIPNWVAGPSNVVAFAILFALRVHAEEQMMSDAFGDEYATYAARTKRLIPGVW